jgi:hypothetical protein
MLGASKKERNVVRVFNYTLLKIKLSYLFTKVIGLMKCRMVRAPFTIIKSKSLRSGLLSRDTQTVREGISSSGIQMEISMRDLCRLLEDRGKESSFTIMETFMKESGHRIGERVEERCQSR